MQTIANRGRAKRMADEYREAKVSGDTETTEKIRKFIESIEGLPLRVFFKKALDGKKETDTQLTTQKQPLAIGDSVEVTLESDYQGRKGVISDIGYGAKETTYYIQLDGEIAILSIPVGSSDLVRFAYLRKL
jgi:hypothetical protein